MLTMLAAVRACRPVPLALHGAASLRGGGPVCGIVSAAPAGRVAALRAVGLDSVDAVLACWPAAFAATGYADFAGRPWALETVPFIVRVV